MLVENATLPWGQSWERVFSQAFVHTVHSTCASGKPFPKIVPMAKLHSLLACAFIMSTYNNLLLKAKGRKKLVKLQYVIIYQGPSIKDVGPFQGGRGVSDYDIVRYDPPRGHRNYDVGFFLHQIKWKNPKNPKKSSKLTKSLIM